LSLDNITNVKWQKLLAKAQHFMEPEDEVIEIDSSDDGSSTIDERGNIAPSSP
jgi:hypothetical protein